jgi:hypothetical protein
MFCVIIILMMGSYRLSDSRAYGRQAVAKD